MFPFGVSPEAGEPEGDDRGPDTVNRLLLHGARYHDRDAVFLHWGQGRQGWGWLPTPDWRADRASIRAALVLSQRLQVPAGGRVALWMPLNFHWGVIERAVWSVSAISVPVWPEWSLEKVAAVLADADPEVLFVRDLDSVGALRAIGGFPESVRLTVPLRTSEEQGTDWMSFDKFMTYGGVLDTPERASMWRTYSRKVKPNVTVSYEYGDPAGTPGDSSDPGQRRTLDHRQMVEAVAAVAHTFPSYKERAQIVGVERPDLLARSLLYAAWADGLTRTVFMSCRAAEEGAGNLNADLVLCRNEAAAVLLAELAQTDGDAGQAGPEKICVVLTDGPPAPEIAAAGGGRIRFMEATELEGVLAGS